MKSPFVIYADSEDILVPDDNRKQNPNETYTNKYKKTSVVVMIVNQYALMINLVNLLNHTVSNFVSSMIEKINFVVM